MLIYLDAQYLSLLYTFVTSNQRKNAVIQQNGEMQRIKDLLPQTQSKIKM